jgi:hypothetical protein
MLPFLYYYLLFKGRKGLAALPLGGLFGFTKVPGFSLIFAHYSKIGS